MEAIIERCCGLDVHRDSIAACLLIGKANEKPVKERRAFGTMSHHLAELAQWLRSRGCTHVAMESTGVYWMAPYRALEEHFEVVVGNAEHLSKVPGRKTDVLDSEWLAELLRHGLIRKSFIPPQPIRELRDLTRYRRKLVQNRSGERNRLQRMLEMANIKLASVMSDVFGASGMDMLRALVEETQAPYEIAKLARGRLRKKIELLSLALDAPFEEHHRYLLYTQLKRLEQLDAAIGDVDQRIAERLSPYREQHERLMQIPGVKSVVASELIAELGVDMSVFPSAQDCASWAGLCPGNNESAGKRKSGRTSRGNPHLRTSLVEAAQSASRKKGSYLRDKFHRLRARRGYKRAVVAIAHKMLLAAYHMLATGEAYRELGEEYLDARDQQRQAKRLIKRLEGLGFEVTLQAREAADKGTSSPQAGSAADRMEPSNSESEEPDMAAKEVVTGQAVAPAAEAYEVEPIESNAETSASLPAEPEPAPHGYRHSESRSSRISSVTDATEETSAMSCGGRVAQSEAPSPASSATSSETSTGISGASTVPSSARPERSPGKPRSTERRQRSHAVKPRDPRLPPVGTTLSRVFKGAEYHVQVLQNGFKYDGEVYSSISRVARAINGKSKNGYAFFHLTKKRKSAAHAEPPQ